MRIRVVCLRLGLNINHNVGYEVYLTENIDQNKNVFTICCVGIIRTICDTQQFPYSDKVLSKYSAHPTFIYIYI